MREVEVKGVVDDLDDRRRRVERAGALRTFTGRLEDRRYDTASRALTAHDVVLRLRVHRSNAGVAAQLDWKGATERSGGFKIRDEVTTPIGDPDALATMLDHLGYVIIREIDRDIDQYDLHGTSIRFERYPRMDTLVEVEGTPDGIERAIQAIALPRAAFTAGRLPDFIRAYEARTGERAAVCDRELAGDYRYHAEDA